MHFSVLFAALFLILSVNASMFEKRSIAAPIQICIDDLNALSANYSVVSNAINVYIPSQGYAGALAIQSQISALETKIDTSRTDCCAVVGPFSDEDATAIIVAVGPLTDKIEALLSVIIAKKPAFDAVSLVTPIIKNDIRTFQTKIVALYNCFVSIAPTSMQSIILGYFARINAAFAAAVAAYP